ncbi:probable flap endonuclease 1 homolog isoform X3 [Varanus komodoensis]|uniref:probable flap endonuclease 1 homolog isoform X3 n=1 Tax=Varanus komodoensis TaxID=61221 RepID=UPI001CF7AD05|nr:probable flap endonuclease 1 homolog isoform X3 [Varanus komodoensis]
MTEQQVGKVSRVPRSGPRSWQPVTLHETPVVAWKLLGAESFASPTCGSPSLLPPSEPTSPVSLPRPGQVVALDASVVICQFCSAMPKIVNRHGQDISALQGLFYRTLHLLENGIKPVFVFDGKPPDLKQAVLAKRALASGVRKGAADPAAGDRKQQLLRHDLETLLRYLGVPSVQAPAEAEATCAALVKSGHAWCTATEDLDALPFGSLRLLRHLNTKSGDLEEIALPEVLQKLRLTQEQFVDLCILLGCDYCGKIHGVGPKKALKLMQQHGSIERILQLTSRQREPGPRPDEEVAGDLPEAEAGASRGAGPRGQAPAWATGPEGLPQGDQAPEEGTQRPDTQQEAERPRQQSETAVGTRALSCEACSPWPPSRAPGPPHVPREEPAGMMHRGTCGNTPGLSRAREPWSPQALCG